MKDPQRSFSGWNVRAPYKKLYKSRWVLGSDVNFWNIEETENLYFTVETPRYCEVSDETPWTDSKQPSS